MQTYEAWWNPDDESYTCAPSSTMADNRTRGLIGPNAKLLYTFTAATLEEAQSIHNLRMGWEPYLPNGDAAECPSCGAWYYPDGSGECWRCSSDSAD